MCRILISYLYIILVITLYQLNKGVYRSDALIRSRFEKSYILVPEGVVSDFVRGRLEISAYLPLSGQPLHDRRTTTTTLKVKLSPTFSSLFSYTLEKPAPQLIPLFPQASAFIYILETLTFTTRAVTQHGCNPRLRFGLSANPKLS